jgi:hypothetical protein
MKKLTFSLLILIAISSCKKNEADATATTAAGAATVTASNYGFDGGSSGKFSATKAGITQITVGGVTTFTISAIKDGSNEAITLILLKKVTTTGKTQFSVALNNGGITLSKDYTKPADQTLNYTTDRGTSTARGGGEINVTKLDGNTIEGTFTAVAYNSAGKESFVEQGAFSGTIQQ